MTTDINDPTILINDPSVFIDGLEPPTVPLLSCILEVAFGVGPYTEPVAWVDLTAWLRNASTRRGRNHELGKTSAGVATFTLDNRDRRFDPTNTSGPYYPNIKPMQHIRLRGMTQDGLIYPVFRGFVEDWGQQWSGPAAAGKGDAFCEVSCVDAFKLLQLMETNPYRAAVLADSPALYFPMDDPVGTAFGANLGDGGDGEDVLTYDPNTEGLVTLAARSDGPFASTALQVAADFRNPSSAGAPAYLPAAEVTLSQGPLTIEFWIKPDSLTGTPNYIVAQTGDYWHVITSGQVSFEYISNREHGIGFTTVTSTGNLTPAGQTHHIAVVRDFDTVAFYQDGVLMDTFGGLGDPYAIPPSVFGLHRIGASFDGILAHLAIYPRALTADQISTHHAATCETITAQPSGAAIDAILNCVGWPAGLRAIGAGMSTVTITPDGSALDAIQQIGEDTEHGILEVTPDGKVTFIGRDVLELPMTPFATFGDGGGAEIPYRDLVLSYDDQDLWTETEVSDAAGDTFVADDDVAVALYGRRTLSVSTVAATANEAQAQSTGLLNRYKAPAVRPVSVTFMGPRSITQQLTRAVGDRVTVSRRPPGSDSLSAGFAAMASDSFTRANSTTLGTTETGGLSWIEGSGDFSISSNRLVCTASGASMAVVDAGITDHAVQVDCAAGGATGQAFVVMRSTGNSDGGNLLIAGFQNASTTLTLFKVLAGAYTSVGTYAAGVHGGIVRCVVQGDAVQVYLNGTLRISYTITDAALRTGTKLGVYGGADANSRWDDLLIERLVLVTVFTPLTVDALIEGINHDVGPDGWLTTSFSLAPPDPGAFWFLEDAVRSVLESTTFPGW